MGKTFPFWNFCLRRKNSLRLWGGVYGQSRERRQGNVTFAGIHLLIHDLAEETHGDLIINGDIPLLPPLPGRRVKLFPAQSSTFYLAREVHQTLLPPDTREDPHQTLRPQSHLHLSIYISLVQCFITILFLSRVRQFNLDAQCTREIFVQSSCVLQHNHIKVDESTWQVGNVCVMVVAA